MALNTDSFFSIKVVRFYLVLVGFWYAETEREEWIQFILRVNTVVAIFFTLFVQGVDFYYSLGNFEELTYNTCITIPVVIIILKVMNFISRRHALLDIIRYSEKKFWNKTYDAFGQKILRECEKQTFVILCILTIAVQGTVFSYVLEPIYDNVGKNETDRILPLRLWINFPVTKTPYYEIIYVIETLCCTFSGICYFVFDNLLGIFNIHVVGQFKILQYRLENLCEEYINNEIDEEELQSDNMYTKDFSFQISDENLVFKRKSVGKKNQSDVCEETNEKLKQCIQHHLVLIDYIQKLEHIFNLVLLCEVAVSSICICISGFQIFIAKQLRYMFHLISAFTEMLIFTYTCNEITVQSLNIGDAAYRSRWYMMPNTKAGRSLRHALMFIIVRSRSPCFLTGGKFTRISLDIFKAILSTTMSYLSLLRKISERQ